MPHVEITAVIEEDIAGFQNRDDQVACWNAIDQFSAQVAAFGPGSVVPGEHDFSSELRVHPTRERRGVLYWTFDFSHAGRVTFRWQVVDGSLVAVLLFATSDHATLPL